MPTAADKRAAREAAIRATNDDAMSDPGSVASARGEIAQPSVAGAKVVVACKIGVPYIDLQICEMVSVREQSLTGEREIIQARRTGSVVRIRGTAYPRGAMPSEFPAPPVIVGGAGLSEKTGSGEGERHPVKRTPANINPQASSPE